MIIYFEDERWNTNNMDPIRRPWPRSEIYHERQVGGWCRLHAINAALGGPFYSQSTLTSLSSEYGATFDSGGGWHPSGDILLDHGTHGGAFRFECFAFERATESRYLCVHLPGRIIQHFLGALRRATSSLTSSLSSWVAEGSTRGVMHDAVMVYNPNHIYTLRHNDGRWMVVDSLSPGPRPTPSVQPLDVVERRDGFGMIICVRTESFVSTFLHPLRHLTVSILAETGFRSADHIYGLISPSPSRRPADYGELEFPLLCILRWMVVYGVASEDSRRFHDALLKSFGKVTLRPELVESVLLPSILVILEGQPGCGWGKVGTVAVSRKE